MHHFLHCYPAMVCDTIGQLQSRGFSCSFNRVNNWLFCSGPFLLFRRSEFLVQEMHYFPGQSGEAGGLMLYGISVPAYAIKGILLLTGPKQNIIFLTLHN